jgi:hypothetical protein
VACRRAAVRHERAGAIFAVRGSCRSGRGRYAVLIAGGVALAATATLENLADAGGFQGERCPLTAIPSAGRFRRRGRRAWGRAIHAIRCAGFGAGVEGVMRS